MSKNHVFWELLLVYAQAWDTGAGGCNTMLILWKNMFSERYLNWI
jgi:hypothetical protein